MTKDRLCSKKVLIVLDDVDHLDQLNLFAESHEWFGPGSRILITTRDKHLLHAHGVDALYEAKELPHKEATLLFSRYAFKQEVPTKDYVDLSNCMVHYAKGLPLALKILGSFLYGRIIDEWHSALDKLKRSSNMEICNVLRISFDGLDDIDKEIFLDIACFFKGEDKNWVSRILESCNFYPKLGINVLCDRCLIRISNNKIQMHDLIQQMGWDIIREQFPKEPDKWSRLWDPNDICQAFSRKKGMKKIEVLSMDLSHIKGIQFNTKVFTQMKRLRLLKVHWSNHIGFMEKKYRVLLPENFEFPSYELKYLYWDGYTLKSLPSNFDGQNIVELHLRYSTIKQLWKGNKCLDKLMVIDLSYSEKLIKMPKFSNMPNLETLVLEGCINLQKFHPSMGDSKKLTFLNLRGCKRLRRFPSSIELESLEILNLSDCSNFEKFPDIRGNMGHLRELLLKKTSINELPRSIGYLESLEFLDLSDCAYFEKFLDIIEGNMRHLRELHLGRTAIRELPSSIAYLESLQILILSSCLNLHKFPEIERNMECIQELHLDNTAIGELPSSIDRLIGLKLLYLNECTNLGSIPNRICRLKSLCYLHLTNCSNLEAFPEITEDMENLEHLLGGTAIEKLPWSIQRLNHLQFLIFDGCKNLVTLPETIGNLRFLILLCLHNCLKLHKLPDSLRNLQSLDGIGLPLPSLSGLYFLKQLDLGGCNLMEEQIPSDIWCLYSLRELNLSKNHIRSLPAAITQLSKLRRLQLSHCRMLEEISMLPPSVRNVEAHECPCLRALWSPTSIFVYLWKC